MLLSLIVSTFKNIVLLGQRIEKRGKMKGEELPLMSASSLVVRQGLSVFVSFHSDLIRNRTQTNTNAAKRWIKRRRKV